MIRQLLLAAVPFLAPGILGAQGTPRPSLPAPLQLPSRDPSEAALELARVVTGGGERGLAALLAALRASGIAVREPGGRVLVAPAEPTQGIAFDPWEVRAMARLAVAGPEQRLDEIGQLLASRFPKLDRTRLQETLHQDLIDDAGSLPTLHFWKIFLLALNPTVIAGTTTESDTAPALSALQTALVLRRLTADLVAAARRSRVGGASDGGSDDVSQGESADQGPTEIPSAFRLGGPHMEALEPSLREAPRTLAPAPCTFNSSGDIVLDVAASGLTTGFGKVMDYLTEVAEAAGGAAEKIATYTGIANVVFAYSKLFMTMAGLKVDFDVEPPGPPVVRPKGTTAEASAVRYVRAKVKIDVGDLAALNCMRTALNVVGLDFTTPKNEPHAGAAVSWSFADRPSPVETRSADWIVRFVGDPAHGTTDKDGVARIGVEGTPQPVRLDDSYLVPDTTEVTLLLLTTLKGRDLVNDLRDFVPAAWAGVATAATLPAELLSRTRWFGARYRLRVVDWRFAFGIKLTGGGDDSMCPERDELDMTEEYEGIIRIGDYPDSASGNTYDGGGQVRWSVRGIRCTSIPGPDGAGVLCTMKVDAGGIGRFLITLDQAAERGPTIRYSFRPDWKGSHVSVAGPCPESDKEDVRQSIGIAHGSFPLAAAVRGPYEMGVTDAHDHRASGHEFVVRLSPPPRERKP